MTKGFRVPPDRVVTRGLHGTDYDFEDEVLPSSAHGQRHYNMSGSDDTYFLPHNKYNENHAWKWAKNTNALSEGGRHRVHITEPHPEQHIDKNLHGTWAPDDDEQWDANARVAPSQRIVGTIWAPPPGQRDSHVEPTLPHMNWRQFGGENWRRHDASNGVITGDRNEVIQESHFTRNSTREFDQVIARRQAREQLPGQLSFADAAPGKGAHLWGAEGLVLSAEGQKARDLRQRRGHD